MLDHQVCLSAVGGIVGKAAVSDRDEAGLSGAGDISSLEISYVPHGIPFLKLELVKHAPKDRR